MGSISIYIIYALIFMSVLLLVEGLFFLISSTTQNEQAANKRMRLIDKTGDENIGITLLQNKSKRGQSVDSRSFLDRLDSKLWMANSKLTLSGFFMLCFGITVAIAAALFIGRGLTILLAIPIGLVFGITVPYLYLSFKASKQQKMFSEQLCPAIDLVSRGLQAGHPAAVALEMVSKEMADPIGTEFGLAIDEINYGQDRNVALSNIARRFPNPDLRFFNSALEVQRETGGNLVDVLTQLSDVIRTRRAMRKKIWALSAEGRFSAIVVGALPFAMFFIISAVNPTFYTQHADDPLQIIGLAIPALLYVIGMYWIVKMIRIEI